MWRSVFHPSSQSGSLPSPDRTGVWGQVDQSFAKKSADAPCVHSEIDPGIFFFLFACYFIFSLSNKNSLHSLKFLSFCRFPHSQGVVLSKSIHPAWTRLSFNSGNYVVNLAHMYSQQQRKSLSLPHTKHFFFEASRDKPGS